MMLDNDSQKLVCIGVSSRLIGDHQAGNAESAVAAALKLKASGFPQITETSMAEGLQAASLAGRFQVGAVHLPA